jgi:hypothetical protein
MPSQCWGQWHHYKFITYPHHHSHSAYYKLELLLYRMWGWLNGCPRSPVISWWGVVSAFRVEALMAVRFAHCRVSRCGVVALDLVMYALDSHYCFLLNKKSRMHHFNVENGASPFFLKKTGVVDWLWSFKNGRSSLLRRQAILRGHKFRDSNLHRQWVFAWERHLKPLNCFVIYANHKLITRYLTKN